MRLGLLLAKTAVSLALLAYLFWSIDLHSLVSIVASANIGPLSVAFLLMVVGIVLSSYKWQVLLMVNGLECRLSELFRFYMIGIYFNNFFPTSIGGDAMRGYLLTQRHECHMAALTSILAERFSGILALMMMALLGIIIIPTVPETNTTVAILVALLLTACGGLVFSTYRFRRFSMRLIPRPFKSHADRFANALETYFFTWKPVWAMLWTSLVFQFLVVSVYAAGCRAFDLDVSYGALMVVVPLVTLATLIPISLNGLGVRECGFVLLLSRFGVGSEEALSLSLIVYGFSLLLSVLGGILFSMSVVELPNDPGAQS